MPGRSCYTDYILMTKSRLPLYVLVGSSAYAAEMSCLYVLLNVLNLKPVVAVALSFWVGFTVAFTLQKLITFKNYDRRPRVLTKQVVSYAALVAWNYGFTLMLVSWLASYVSPFVIRTGAIMIIAFWNYFIYHRIFKVGALPEPL